MFYEVIRMDAHKHRVVVDVVHCMGADSCTFTLGSLGAHARPLVQLKCRHVYSFSCIIKARKKGEKDAHLCSAKTLRVH
jgi:hypothetical protein